MKVIVEIVNREDKMKEVVIPKSQVPTPSPKFQFPSPKPPISTVQTQVTVPSPNPQSQSLSQSQVKEGVVEEKEKEEEEEDREEEIEKEEIEEEEEETMSENGSREEMEEDEEIDFKLCICQMSERKKERWRDKIVWRAWNREPGKKREDVVKPQWPCPCKVSKCPNKMNNWTKEKLEKRERKISRRKWREENRKGDPLNQILINQI